MSLVSVNGDVLLLVASLLEPLDALRLSETSRRLPISVHALELLSIAGPPEAAMSLEIDIADPSRVAEFLDTLFPEVEVESYSEGDWQKALQAARRTARA